MRTNSGYDWIYRPTRFAIYHRDAFRCLSCMKKFKWTGKRKGLSLDHVVPLSSGGKNSPDNLLTLCIKCNNSKGSKDLSTWVSTLKNPIETMVRMQVALRTPIDRLVGRSLCDALCPGFLERHKAAKAASRKRTAQRKSEAEFIPF